MAKETLKDKAYQIIKGKILNCSYAPNTFINESIIQMDVSASRTPIREALNRLEQENLLKILPKKGVLISDLSINEINKVYETRMLVEPYIIRMYGSLLDLSKLDFFRQVFSGEKVIPEQIHATKIDDEFHFTICAPCQNEYLLQLLRNINMQNHRIRILSGYSSSRIQQSCIEHMKIIDALWDQDSCMSIYRSPRMLHSLC